MRFFYEVNILLSEVLPVESCQSAGGCELLVCRGGTEAGAQAGHVGLQSGQLGKVHLILYCNLVD